MSRVRSKPDFSAGVYILSDDKRYRALELHVRGDDLYALRPRRGGASKVSYHSSGDLHYKLGDSPTLSRIIELPPKLLKERAFSLGREQRRLFTSSLEHLREYLEDTSSHTYDKTIEIRIPELQGLFVIELYVGRSSGQKLVFEIENYVEATITERLFSGAGYDFVLRLAILSEKPVYVRTLHEQLVGAWRAAIQDLGIRGTAPFAIRTDLEEPIFYEAYLPDFGGRRGIIVGLLSRDHFGDLRAQQGFAISDWPDAPIQYERQKFIDALNDWQWSGETGKAPPWYTGKRWA